MTKSIVCTRVPHESKAGRTAAKVVRWSFSDACRELRVFPLGGEAARKCKLMNSSRFLENFSEGYL